MVPMLDPMMMPDATMLLDVSPSLLGVMTAVFVAVAFAVVGTASELGRTRKPRAATPGAAASRAPAPLPA